MDNEDKKDEEVGAGEGGERPGGEKNDDGGLNIMRRDLYAREEREDFKARQEALRSLGGALRPGEEVEKETDTLAATRYKNVAAMRAKRTGRWLRLIGLMAAIIFVTVWGVAITIWYRSALEVTENDILLEIEAPQEFTAGEEIFYRIVYTNDSRVDWHDVDLTVSPPRGFKLSGSNLEMEQSGQRFITTIGNLEAREEGELHVRGQLIGEQGEAAQLRAEMLITPDNFPSGRFAKEAVVSTTITALSLEVGLGLPQDAASGERVSGSVTVRNLSNQVLENVYLKLALAEELALAPEDSEFSPGFKVRDSEWQIEALEPLESRDFTLVFFMAGLTGERRVIDIEAGLKQDEEKFVQREVTHVVRVSASELVVEQLYNGSSDPISVKAGETVSGEVNYANVGTVGLKDVIIEMAFKGDEYNPASIESPAGFFDPIGRKIVWTAASVPGLAVVQPKQSGTVSFSFAMAGGNQLVADGLPSRNNLLVTVATLDSPDLPAPPGQPRLVISDRAVISVGTELTFDAVSFYDDGRLGIQSTGPVPPQVGETTTYTLRFRLGTTINDVGNIKMRARLPDGVAYTGKNYLTDGNLDVNPRSGDVTWTIPYMEGLTGRVRPPLELHIQVAITPGENRQGSSIELLNGASVEGTDQFTDQTVTATAARNPSTEKVK